MNTRAIRLEELEKALLEEKVTLLMTEAYYKAAKDAVEETELLIKFHRNKAKLGNCNRRRV